ncbi:hypothetical protein ABGM65_005138, partial [Escherichia coli]|nr:hypothetical protein [Escherichia coli]HDE7361923.1 hypothetical protein [Escherichia coli]
MIKNAIFASSILFTFPIYAEVTSVTVGYNFVDFSGEYGNRNLAYAELVAKIENATLLFN